MTNINIRTTHYDIFNTYIQKRINAAVRSVIYRTNVTIQALKDELKHKEILIEDYKRLEQDIRNKYLRDRENRDQEHGEQEHREQDFRYKNLRDNNIREQDIPEQNFPQQDLPEQDLPDQVLPEQDLPEQDLPDQDLPEQDLPYQDLPEQDIRDHDLRENDLLEPNLTDQNLILNQKPAVFPKALIKWCDRAFAACASKEDVVRMGTLLRAEISDAIKHGTVLTTPWSIIHIPMLEPIKHPPNSTDLARSHFKHNKEKTHMKKKTPQT